MGQSTSKGKISQEDLQFLLKNTNHSKEEIMVSWFNLHLHPEEKHWSVLTEEKVNLRSQTANPRCDDIRNISFGRCIGSTIHCFLRSITAESIGLVWPGISLSENLDILLDESSGGQFSIDWVILPQEWHVGFMEDCPDGELTKAQFVEMYNKIFPGGCADKFSEIIFRTFDTDRSGTIDFREFMLALHVTRYFSHRGLGSLQSSQQLRNCWGEVDMGFQNVWYWRKRSDWLQWVKEVRDESLFIFDKVVRSTSV